MSSTTTPHSDSLHPATVFTAPAHCIHCTLSVYSLHPPTACQHAMVPYLWHQIRLSMSATLQSVIYVCFRTACVQGDTWDCATKDERDAHLTLWPGAAVAAPLRCLGDAAKGMSFATLPTGILTGYPVHVNARWALSDNRKAIVAGNMASQATQVSPLPPHSVSSPLRSVFVLSLSCEVMMMPAL